MAREADPPTGYHSITPRIFVEDVSGLVGFLRTVFRGSCELRDSAPTEVRIGESIIMVSSTAEREPFPAFLYIYVADVDETYHRALDAGALSVEPPIDQPYGDRRAMVRDPFGNIFQIATRATTSAPDRAKER